MLPAKLGKFFTLAEWNRVSDPTPPALEQNVLRTVAALDAIREAIGVPILLTSGYRSLQRNARVGGSESSDHPHGLAADFKPQGIDLHEFHRRFVEADRAGKIPPYDQLIVYPYTTKHAHLGMGARLRRQHLLKTAGDEYAVVTDTSQIPSNGVTLVPVVGALAIVGLLAIAFRKYLQ